MLPVAASGGIDAVVTITVKFMNIASQRSGAGVVEFTIHESKLVDAGNLDLADYSRFP